VRGPINDRFTDYKKIAIRYRTWANTWFLIAMMEGCAILFLVFIR
jgi:hypothetical protein